MLHNSATQRDQQVSKPTGLFARGGSWGLRVRVPDRLREHLKKKEIWRSFGAVDYKEACRLARIERVAIDRQFAEAEAEMQQAPPPPLSEAQLYELARAFLHKMEVEAHPIPVLRQERKAELEAIDEEASLVGQSLEDAALQRVAINMAEWAGLRLEHNPVDFLKICEVVQEAWIEHLGRRSDKLAGRHVRSIDPIFEGVEASQPLAAPLTVAAAIQLYKNDPERSGVAAKTRAAWQFRFRTIEELLGPDRLIGSIKREDIRACRDALIQMPSNAAKHFPRMSAKQAIVAGARDGLPKLSPKSVTLYVELISSLFKWLEREEFVSRNPAQGVKGPPQAREKPKRPLTTDEIHVLFTATDCTDTQKPWHYWLPRIALRSGLRLNEIAGLMVQDLTQIEGIWCFRVRPNELRDLKTSTSTRDVPLHPELIEMALPELTANRLGNEPLFSDLPSSGGNATQKRLGRIVRGAISDPKASFHSLRHNFRDALRHAGVPSDISARLGGWVGRGSESMEAYGHGHSTSTLASWVSRLTFQSLE